MAKRGLKVGEEGDSGRQAAGKILLAGGIAGVVTWASIFPLDVIKTRVQTQPFKALLSPAGSAGSSRASSLSERTGLLPRAGEAKVFKRKGAIEIARLAYANDGFSVFFRGLGICSVRAFIVNAVQWAVYEWMMRMLVVRGAKGVGAPDIS